WAKLNPDDQGSYVNGTWTMLAPMNYERTDFSSAVLPDGRVFVIGGEYTNNAPGGFQGEIYDPVLDKWTLASLIPKTLFDQTKGAEFDDAQSMVIQGGKVLLAPVRSTNNNSTLLYDPATDSWSAGAAFVAGRNQDETTWLKLPDNSVLTPDNDNIHSERYIPSANQWVDDAPVPSSNQLFKSGEMGAALLLPNGNGFFIGATGHTLLYKPSGSSMPGTWSAGPDIPSSLGASDAPAAMLPDGKILVVAGTNPGDGGTTGPTYFFLYDYSAGTNGSFTAIGCPTNPTAGSQAETNATSYIFLDLPDGSVLVTHQSANPPAQLYVFKPGGTPVAAGKPNILSILRNTDGTYHLVGTGINGISAGASFGDDVQMDSNYPLVRLTDDQKRVSYARTFHWSSTAVMTGNQLLSTEFEVPANILSKPGGTRFTLDLVANGIGSNTVTFTVPYSFNTEKWTGAWGSDGPIFTGDLSGDGKTDVFMWRNSTHSWTVNLSTGKGFIQQGWTGAWGSDGPIFTGDLNGDRKTDVFMWRNSTHSWTVNLSTGTGFTQLEWTGAWGSDGPIFTGDLNGDGKTDVFMWRNPTHSWTVNLSNGKGFSQQEWQGAWGSDGPIFTGDLNGDGKTDVFMWRNSTHSWTVNLSNGKGFSQQEWQGAWGSDGPIFTGDLNGDGKTDVFMWRNSTHSWTVNLSTGTGFSQQEWTGAWGSDGPIFTGDLNGDGKTDVFMWRNATKTWTVNLSSGSGFNQVEMLGMWGSDGPIFLGDVNGDHKTDIFMWRDADKSWSINLSPW
ncbi:MAG TPA: FG-GAP-like repeat-containing protein, partial [Puia sp.]|nr:FG-GAP-like repeat-containing protein [Puia sp.]